MVVVVVVVGGVGVDGLHAVAAVTSTAPCGRFEIRGWKGGDVAGLKIRLVSCGWGGKLDRLFSRVCRDMFAASG